MASHNSKEKRNEDTFQDFSEKKEHVDKDSFLKWLGDVPCVLIVDELNNLNQLSQENSEAASEFASFVKRHFIAKRNRYFVFSSHQVSTLEFFSFFVNSSAGSVRPVILQELPITDTLAKALQLNSSLDSAREAVYHGLLPGLIFKSADLRSIAGNRVAHVSNWLGESKDLDEDFRNILRSMIDGNPELVPKQLHMILDTAGNERGPSVIRWVPFHLSYVLHRLAKASKLPYTTREIASNMQKLCDSLHDSKTFSGDGWEGIFVLFLLARCLTGESDEYFVPSKWFLEEPKVLYNNPYNSQSTPLIGNCKNLKELLEGVAPGTKPQLSILFPTTSRFETYDVLAVYSKDGQNQSIYGYQLKEGSASVSKADATGVVERSFWVQGKSPENDVSKKHWEIADKASIDKFYGESGKHWTPEQWRKFEETK